MASLKTYSLQKTLGFTPHVSCLAFGHANHILVGAEDGSLRLYDLLSFKVMKAIRRLGSELSSIVCFERPGSELRDVWLGCGGRALHFQLDSPKVIQTLEDALSVIDLGQADGDMLNELAMNANKTHLAFSLDSGIVGVVNLSTMAVLQMNAAHESLCGCVKFIPDRPREIVSGGYDAALIHHDFIRGNVLSRRKIPAAEITAGEMALAPPFVICTAISPTGVMAAGTADGRVWFGFGGKRRAANAKKKRIRKWEGLKEGKELVVKVADGPVIAIALDESGTLTISTLLGAIAQYKFIEKGNDRISMNKIWETKTETIEKVNALVVDGRKIIVGGLTVEGTGVFEIWEQVITE